MCEQSKDQWRLMNKVSPFRAHYVENNESSGHATAEEAVQEAENWKRAAELRWGTNCGRFEATAFGVLIAAF